MLGLGFLAWRMFAAHYYWMAFSTATAVYAIAIAILPRRDHFEAPGPELRRDEHPELFRVIEAVAESTGERMPSAVYLTPYATACVGERGGLLGFGTQRIMELGLPILEMLNVDEFRSVIAHEFGHYNAGDTRFSCWIYTARAAVGRAVVAMDAAHSSVRVLFTWYGAMFLRI